MNDSDSIENTTSSVPVDTKIVMMGFNDNDELTSRFGEYIKNVILECGRYLDLSLLDGVTVGFDYEEALQSVNLGYESSIAKSYTDTDDLIGVAKVLRIKKENLVKVHVVYNANYLSLLTDHTHPDWFATLNIIAHELGHVCVIAWFENHSKGIMLENFQGDWLKGQLLNVAYTCWEEYAACRLASKFNHKIVEENYLRLATSQVIGAFSIAHGIINSYRTNGDLTNSVIGVIGAVANPIKFVSYYLGHMVGVQNEEGISENIERFGVYSPFINDIRIELQRAWDSRENWDGLNGLNGFLYVLLNILSAAGMDIYLDRPEYDGRSYVNFPLTHQIITDRGGDRS